MVPMKRDSTNGLLISRISSLFHLKCVKPKPFLPSLIDFASPITGYLHDGGASVQLTQDNLVDCPTSAASPKFYFPATSSSPRSTSSRQLHPHHRRDS